MNGTVIQCDHKKNLLQVADEARSVSHVRLFVVRFAASGTKSSPAYVLHRFSKLRPQREYRVVSPFFRFVEFTGRFQMDGSEMKSKLVTDQVSENAVVRICGGIVTPSHRIHYLGHSRLSLREVGNERSTAFVGSLSCCFRVRATLPDISLW